MSSLLPFPPDPIERGCCCDPPVGNAPPLNEMSTRLGAVFEEVCSASAALTREERRRRAVKLLVGHVLETAYAREVETLAEEDFRVGSSSIEGIHDEDLWGIVKDYARGDGDITVNERTKEVRIRRSPRRTSAESNRGVPFPSGETRSVPWPSGDTISIVNGPSDTLLGLSVASNGASWGGSLNLPPRGGGAFPSGGTEFDSGSLPLLLLTQTSPPSSQRYESVRPAEEVGDAAAPQEEKDRPNASRRRTRERNGTPPPVPPTQLCASQRQEEEPSPPPEPSSVEDWLGAPSPKKARRTVAKLVEEVTAAYGEDSSQARAVRRLQVATRADGNVSHYCAGDLDQAPYRAFLTRTFGRCPVNPRHKLNRAQVLAMMSVGATGRRGGERGEEGRRGGERGEEGEEEDKAILV